MKRLRIGVIVLISWGILTCCHNSTKTNASLCDHSQDKTCKMDHIDADEILKILVNLHNNKGYCSNLTINEEYMKTFREWADYGPMWYGDTLFIEKDVFVINYKYDCPNYDITSNPTNDWHSTETLYIAKDKSVALRSYTCTFGGNPPSHGFAHRKIKWTSDISQIHSLLVQSNSSNHNR